MFKVMLLAGLCLAVPNLAFADEEVQAIPVDPNLLLGERGARGVKSVKVKGLEAALRRTSLSTFEEMWAADPNTLARTLGTLKVEVKKTGARRLTGKTITLDQVDRGAALRLAKGLIARAKAAKGLKGKMNRAGLESLARAQARPGKRPGTR